MLSLVDYLLYCYVVHIACHAEGSRSTCMVGPRPRLRWFTSFGGRTFAAAEAFAEVDEAARLRFVMG